MGPSPPKQNKEKTVPLLFYQEEEVVEVAQALLGKYLFTSFEGQLTGGMIIETEAYKGAEDKACHAYGERKTARTQVMFEPGGVAYIYLCYGIHHLFNIVTHKEGTPHAVLVRALAPTHGTETMEKRRKGAKKLTGGPGTLTQALGIQTHHSGIPLTGNEIWLEDHGAPLGKIIATPRIGIDYAEEHKNLPWRFLLN
ncbi:DNA-3-methyladenine glycosylase [Candidatus Neptunochlamydia vexilliferae]|uniref:DNA-3-methyladenine glycosylase n=1 Tax=Candidatus Neptunichlamydia vexilliferae TaxID=1651774 RepID=UPI0018919228|nr:DNA-3-methyladenine glycosylase [Candidatus Neptunochlamydia vexilliferae]